MDILTTCCELLEERTTQCHDMNGALQVIGFILNTVGYICVILATALPEWRRNDPSGEVLESIIRHQGIWVRCISYPTGQWQCDDYDSFFLGLPQPLQVARGLTVTSCVIGGIGLVIALLGMKCTGCMEDSPKSKSRTSLIGAVCFAISGLGIGIAVSYYAHQVLSEYNRNSLLYSDDVGQRYIYGSCLFIGWAALSVMVLGSIIAACGSMADDEEDSMRRSPYMPTYNKAHKSNTEYV